MDWLSDWKEIRKGGAAKVKAGIKKEKHKKSEPIEGEYREVNAEKNE